MVGADRDWVSLANALGPEVVRLTWIGINGTECIRRAIDPLVCSEVLDLDLPAFNYAFFENAERERSAWLWSKIVLDYSVRCTRAVHQLRRMLPTTRPDVVVSTTASVLVGSAFALWHRLPHLWCVKECLDPRLRSTRMLARWIEWASSAVAVPSLAVATPFSSAIRVLPDGNDVAAITRIPMEVARPAVTAELNLPPDRPLVVQVGGNIPLKGAHITAEAFVRLCASHGEPPCSLLFLGEPGAAYRSAIDAILQRGGNRVAGCARFVYFSPEDFRYLAAADVVVHPSVAADSFPNAVREAMILGKPVVGSRIGGIPEMIRDGETGLLVPPDDADALARALAMTLARVDFRERLGHQAAQFARQAYDINTTKRPFEELLRLIAKKSRNATGS